MINAREDSLAQKPSHKNAFKNRRYLIPANGCYEWTGPKGDKQPYFITTTGIEEKVGRQFVDDMTPARASSIRSELIGGKRLTRKEARRQEAERKKQEAGKWTIDKLWTEYKVQ